MSESRVNFGMDWGAEVSGMKKLDGNNDNFYKIMPGGNLVRIVGKPSEVFNHWERDASGKIHKIVCLGDDCPICAAGGKAKRTFNVKVIDKRDWTKKEGYLSGINVKIASLPLSVFQQIQTLYKDPDFGDPSGYDINISKIGEKLNTQYSVVGKPPVPLTEEEIEAVKNSIDVKATVKINTIDEIKEMNLKIFNTTGDSVGEEEDMPAPPKKKAPEPDGDWDNFN